MTDKELLIQIRQETGAGIVDIKEAVEEAAGDKAKAIEILRKKGQKIAAKRSERTAGEGWIGSYVHHTGKLAGLVELQCETDFVARNNEFQELAHDLALQVVASNPSYLRREDVPAEIINKEKEIYSEEVKGKPAEVLEKITQGKLEKFYSEVCLLDQPFIKDDEMTVKQAVEQATAKTGEKIAVTGFYRLQI